MAYGRTQVLNCFCHSVAISSLRKDFILAQSITHYCLFGEATRGERICFFRVGLIFRTVRVPMSSRRRTLLDIVSRAYAAVVVVMHASSVRPSRCMHRLTTHSLCSHTLSFLFFEVESTFFCPRELEQVKRNSSGSSAGRRRAHTLTRCSPQNPARDRPRPFLPDKAVVVVHAYVVQTENGRRRTCCLCTLPRPGRSRSIQAIRAILTSHSRMRVYRFVGPSRTLVYVRQSNVHIQ